MILEALRNEIKNLSDNEIRYNTLCKMIHEEYYRLFPNDNRAIDRTKLDYPAFLLQGIIDEEMWEE